MKVAGAEEVASPRMMVQIITGFHELEEREVRASFTALAVPSSLQATTLWSLRACN